MPHTNNNNNNNNARCSAFPFHSPQPFFSPLLLFSHHPPPLLLFSFFPTTLLPFLTCNAQHPPENENGLSCTRSGPCGSVLRELHVATRFTRRPSSEHADMPSPLLLPQSVPKANATQATPTKHPLPATHCIHQQQTSSGINHSSLHKHQITVMINHSPLPTIQQTTTCFQTHSLLACCLQQRRSPGAISSTTSHTTLQAATNNNNSSTSTTNNNNSSTHQTLQINKEMHPKVIQRCNPNTHGKRQRTGEEEKPLQLPPPNQAQVQPRTSSPT